MYLRTRSHVWAVLLVALTFNARLTAQSGVGVSGRLLNSLSGEPIGGVTVQIDELTHQTNTAADGTFNF